MTSSKWLKIGLWAGGILILLLIVFNIWTWWGLSDARKKSIEAEIAREKAIASEEQIRKNSEAIILRIEAEKAELRQVAEQARQSAQTALSAVAGIRQQLRIDQSNVPRLTDTQLTVRSQELLHSAYPDSSTKTTVAFDGTGYRVSREFVEAATKGFIEVVSLREENTSLRKAVDEQAKQVTALMEIVDADKAKTIALENRIQSLEDVMRTDDALVKALQTELKAEKRKNLWRKVWGGVAIAGGVVAGVLVGKSIS